MRTSASKACGDVLYDFRGIIRSLFVFSCEFRLAFSSLLCARVQYLFSLLAPAPSSPLHFSLNSCSATTILLTHGQITFANISFSYPQASHHPKSYRSYPKQWHPPVPPRATRSPDSSWLSRPSLPRAKRRARLRRRRRLPRSRLPRRPPPGALPNTSLPLGIRSRARLRRPRALWSVSLERGVSHTLSLFLSLEGLAPCVRAISNLDEAMCYLITRASSRQLCLALEGLGLEAPSVGLQTLPCTHSPTTPFSI